MCHTFLKTYNILVPLIPKHDIIVSTKSSRCATGKSLTKKDSYLFSPASNVKFLKISRELFKSATQDKWINKSQK